MVAILMTSAKLATGHVQKYGGTFAKEIQIYSDC